MDNMFMALGKSRLKFLISIGTGLISFLTKNNECLDYNNGTRTRFSQILWITRPFQKISAYWPFWKWLNFVYNNNILLRMYRKVVNKNTIPTEARKNT